MDIDQVITDYIRRTIMTTRGDMLIRGVADAERLASVAVGYALRSQGVGLQPAWIALPTSKRYGPFGFIAEDNKDTAMNVNSAIVARLYNTTVGFLERSFACHVDIPNGVTVSELQFNGYRNDALATITLKLLQILRTGAGVVDMAVITPTGAGGAFQEEESTILGADPIDNDTYYYALWLSINNNDNIFDTHFNSARITWTWV